MLYTTYLSKMKSLPVDMKKYFIVRLIPPRFDVAAYQNFKHVPQLSPSIQLLAKWKNHDISWEIFETLFLREIHASNAAQQAIKHIAEEIKSGEDIALICFEKDFKHCHRTPTAKETGCEFQEWG